MDRKHFALIAALFVSTQAFAIDRDLAYECTFQQETPVFIDCGTSGTLTIHEFAAATMSVSCIVRKSSFDFVDNEAGISQIGTAVTLTGESEDHRARVEILGLGADFAAGVYDSVLTLDDEEPVSGTCTFANATE